MRRSWLASMVLCALFGAAACSEDGVVATPKPSATADAGGTDAGVGPGDDVPGLLDGGAEDAGELSDVGGQSDVSGQSDSNTAGDDVGSAADTVTADVPPPQCATATD